MIYKTSAQIFFTTEDEARDFYHDCQLALAKGTVVKPGQTDQECSTIQWEECRHDETPPQPCTNIEHEDNCPSP